MDLDELDGTLPWMSSNSPTTSTIDVEPISDLGELRTSNKTDTQGMYQKSSIDTSKSISEPSSDLNLNATEQSTLISKRPKVTKPKTSDQQTTSKVVSISATSHVAPHPSMAKDPEAINNLVKLIQAHHKRKNPGQKRYEVFFNHVGKCNKDLHKMFLTGQVKYFHDFDLYTRKNEVLKYIF